MRLVLDTNVVMSALLWRGKPYQLLEAIRQRSNLQLYSSGALLEELADVLLYLIRLSDKLDIDLLTAAGNKLAANAEKYPVAKSRGSSKKYKEL